MDDTTNSPPAGQLATEHVCGGDIGIQLINIESVLQTIREQASVLESSGMETSALELKSLLPKLESLQTSHRKTFDAHARPLIRDPHVFDLPDELLRNIFLHVAGGLETKGIHRIVARSDIRSIMNCRLVCHRFCDSSSHLLLWQLDVAITIASLARLEEVSGHPTISKGVKCLRIYAGLYDSIMATTFREFEVEAARIIRQTELSGEEYLDLSCSDKSQYQAEQEQNSQILRAVEEHIMAGSSGKDEDEHVVALRRAYDRYKQLLSDQKFLLQGNTFFQRVANAVARMPTIAEFAICDGAIEIGHPWTQGWSPMDQILQKVFPEPHCWSLNVLEQSVQPSADFLYQLPLAVGRSGSFLTKLCVIFTPALDLKLNLGEDEVSNVLRGLQHLQNLRIFCCAHEVADQENQPSNLSKLVRLFLQAPSLQDVGITFRGLNWGSDGDLVSLLPWTKLRKISLSYFSIRFDNFTACLEQLQPGARITLNSVGLLTGTWADLLDVLRTKADRASSVFNPSGGEFEDPDFLYKFFLAAQGGASRFNQYLGGHLSENPVRQINDGSGTDEAGEVQL